MAEKLAALQYLSLVNKVTTGARRARSHGAHALLTAVPSAPVADAHALTANV
jgi:hypothetical protein